jgi:hypothetical protein
MRVQRQETDPTELNLQNNKQGGWHEYLSRKIRIHLTFQQSLCPFVGAFDANLTDVSLEQRRCQCVRHVVLSYLGLDTVDLVVLIANLIAHITSHVSQIANHRADLLKIILHLIFASVVCHSKRCFMFETLRVYSID